MKIGFMSWILMGVLVFQPHILLAHGEEDHDAGELNTKMSIGEVKSSMAMGEGKEDVYIRYDSPVGNSIVLGRPNPQITLEPEIVTENGNKIKVFKMNVKDIEFEIAPGKKVQAFAFNGTVPGPTIRVTEGDRFRVILTNDSKDEHTLHIHGQSKPLDMDGVPYLGQPPLKKGDSYTYEFTANRPGTHWYHCHVDSAHHVDMGMYGALIVDPKKEKLRYDREYTIILDEWPGGHIHIHGGEMEMEDHMGDVHGVVTEHMGEPRHDEKAPKGEMTEKEGEMIMQPAEQHMDMDMHHAEPVKQPADRDWYPKTYNPYTPVYDTFTINGRSFPYTEPLDVREGERVRIRIINAGYEQHYMHTHSHKFEVVALDGNPVPGKPQVKDTVEVGPGQRADIILIADNPGVWPFHCHKLPHVTNDNIYPGGMFTFIRYIE